MLQQLNALRQTPHLSPVHATRQVLALKATMPTEHLRTRDLIVTNHASRKMIASVLQALDLQVLASQTCRMMLETVDAILLVLENQTILVTINANARIHAYTLKQSQTPIRISIGELPMKLKRPSVTSSLMLLTDVSLLLSRDASPLNDQLGLVLVYSLILLISNNALNHIITPSLPIPPSVFSLYLLIALLL
jgi:hypothetical protein